MSMHIKGQPDATREIELKDFFHGSKKITHNKSERQLQDLEENRR